MHPRRTILIVTGAEVMTLERFKSKLVFRSIGLIAQAHGDIWWLIEEMLDVYLLEGKLQRTVTRSSIQTSPLPNTWTDVPMMGEGV